MKDLSRSLILLQGEPKTLQIESIVKISSTAYRIVFKNGNKAYTYSCDKVVWLKNPKWLNPQYNKLYRGNTQLMDLTEIWRFEWQGEIFWHVVNSSGYLAEYTGKDLRISSSCLDEKSAENRLKYLKDVASINALGRENGECGILSNLYEKIDDVSRDTVAACYLSPLKCPIRTRSHQDLIYPFGCNASQKQAVARAFEKQLSVIQGPPGTGKTQTILNIIANLVRNGKKVLVVSNNNAATTNVSEKLERYGLDFIVATLGKNENKEHFIQNQPEIPEELETWECSYETEEATMDEVHRNLQELDKVFKLQNDLSELRQERQAIDLEWKHFCLENDLDKNSVLKRHIPSSRLLSIWLDYQQQKDEKRISDPGFFKRFSDFLKGIWLKMLCRFRLKLKTPYDTEDTKALILELQKLYYLNRRWEIASLIEDTERALKGYEASSMVAALTEDSMVLFKHALFQLYGNRDRTVFADWKDLKRQASSFRKEYPVVLSTTFSARNCLLNLPPFDYVIMDEASQVSVETGFLALTCACNAVIVGDKLQLPNVITDEDRTKLDTIMAEFQIPASYDCAKNSFLQSVCAVIPEVPQTLLREHYRCHPKIINFCNQQFYGGHLLIMTHDEGEENVLEAIQTRKGNHATNQFNQREIDVIKDEVLPNLQADDEVGIVTPYNHQVEECLKQIPEVETATIHKYQGREKGTIILSVVDNQITDFADDAHLLNVAVSRARNKFILVVNGNEQNREGNITHLLDYIHYNNCTVTKSKTASIFDYLYAQYTEKRLAFLQSHPQISEYASENLTYTMILSVLESDDRFGCFKVRCHVPLRQIIRDTSLLSPEEFRYAANYRTHVDFLIINQVNKKPTLAIETDGYSFHNEETVQHQRDKMKDHILKTYELPLLRLSTKGSGEKRKVKNALLKIVEG